MIGRSRIYLGVARRVQAGEAEALALPLSVSVLISAGESQAAAERRGWGCFAVKRQVAAAGAAEAHHRIELFLYAEAGRRSSPSAGPG